MRTDLIETLIALNNEFESLLFVPWLDEPSGYKSGCEDTKRDAMQLIESKIKEVEALPV